MKRSILTMVFTVAVIAMQAQTAVLKKHEVDEFTGTEIKTTEVTRSNGLSFYIGQFGGKDAKGSFTLKAIYLSSTWDIGCSGAEGNYVTFLFTDKTILDIEGDISDIDCGDYATSTYLLTEEQIEIIMSKKLDKVRLKQSDTYSDHVIKNQDILIELITITNL